MVPNDIRTLLTNRTKLNPPDDKSMVSKDSVKLDMIAEYMHRFEQKNWAAVVKLVVQHAGPVLTGPFKQFNDVAALVGFS